MNQEAVPGAEKIYLQIGQLIFDILPSEFIVAWVSIEMIDNASSCAMFYRKPDERFQYLNVGLDEIESKFRELRILYNYANQEVWTGATFTLSQEGHFTIDTTYYDISDFGKASERRKVWINKYLGENAAIDWQ